MQPDAFGGVVVNGVPRAPTSPPDTALVRVLREELGLLGVRSGCGIGECGSCTVLVDGEPTRSCITPLSSVLGASITTPEGLGTPDAPHPVQRAFLDEQAAQCGYCTNGIIMTTAALLARHPDPTDAQVQEALVEHICRCGTHARVLRAIRRAALRPAGEGAAARWTSPGAYPYAGVVSAESARGNAERETPAQRGARGDGAAGDGAAGDGDRALGGGDAAGPDAPPPETLPPETRPPEARPPEPLPPEARQPEALPPDAALHPRVEDWLELLPDGTVRAHSGKVEIGQGIRTALAQLVAAELGLEPSAVRVVPAVTGRSPDEGYTAGSASLERGGAALAAAAAAARRLLLARAGRLLGAPADALVLERSGVRAPDGACVPLARLAAEGALVGAIEARDRPRWRGRGLGAPAPRDDLRPKLTGAPAFVHDLVLPGMLHARALLPPTYGARLLDLARDAADGVPGLTLVHRDASLVLVVADTSAAAERALARLARAARWEPAPLPPLAPAWFEERGAPSVTAASHGNADEALRAGARRLQAEYAKPYEAHAALAPSCAVARSSPSGDALEVWTHSQGIYPLRRELAALLRRDEAGLTVHHGDGPGCYGHNGADDAAAFAVLAALRVPGRPVRFQFSVDDEFAWEPYGTPMRARLEAALDGRGHIAAWRHEVHGDVHTARPNGDGDRLVPAWLVRGRPFPRWAGPGEPGHRNAVPLYDLPSCDVRATFHRLPLRVSALRTLGAYLNVFAIESFVDELAHAAGRDPVAFRLEHLSDDRARAVLDAAVAAAGWSPATGPSGRGIGVALARYKNQKAYVAHVVEAVLDATTGSVTARRIVTACDAGAVVNADGLRNQLEGGALQGLSRALHEEVRFGPDGIVTRDWTTYPVLRFAETPHLEVVLIDGGGPPLGAGEAATPPLAPALANAVFDASGIRLRELPLTPERVRRRLMDMGDDELEGVILR